MAEFSKAQARRMALAAQGFYDAAGAPKASALRRVLDRINLFQIDSVNVLVRSHYLPLFSRIGPYPVSLLQDAAWGARSKRKLFEYWAHEASLVPLEHRPLLQWRMERARNGKGMWKHISAVGAKRAFVQSLLREIRDGGPMPASSFKKAAGTGTWWGWSDVKSGLEYLFWAGELTAATRTSSFERVYDLPERVFSTAVMQAPAPSRADAQRELMRLALRAMGVATQADLRDYFRLDLLDARHALDALVESGEVLKTTVEEWQQPAYVFAHARIPRTDPKASALLSPFDSLIWNRQRAHRLFDFHYRIEIYTPAHKRLHGYYVLPFLHDGALVARADLKADRAASVLQVHSIHFENARAERESTAALRAQLESLASWLGLAQVALRSTGQKTGAKRPTATIKTTGGKKR